MIGRRLGLVVAALAVLAGAGAAQASGPGEEQPWYIDRYGGDAADLRALYDGRLGIVMARAPRPQLYMAWRLLHGQKVGPAAGAALSIPCCDGPMRALQYDDKGVTGASAWLAARKLVKGAPAKPYTPTGQEQPYFMWSQACYDEAFSTAAATLKSRVASYGAASPWVQAWLDVQDAVFANCRENTALPALPDGAPGWLKADRAYQEAARALYVGETEDAAARFAAIGRDRASPWRPMAPYLQARAWRRAALAQPSADRFARARVAIAELARMPAGTFGRGQVMPMLRSLDYRERPKDLLAELSAELSQPAVRDDLAVSFRDMATLTDRGVGEPEIMAWIAALRPQVSDKAASGVEWKAEAVARLESQARRSALARAQVRWSQTRDVAWLIAALAIVEPGAPEAVALQRAGEGVAAGHPGWLSVQYHLVRLSLRTAPAAASRARLDAILARNDLSVSDRNVFTAQRLQVAADARDFVRFALRKRLCDGSEQGASYRAPLTSGCVRTAWRPDSIQPDGIYDQRGYSGTQGFGEDARAVIDRLPLRERIALCRDARLPTPLRLDVALTSYARAVMLQDHAAADALAADLVTLLPQMATDWQRVRKAPAGAAKRFAEFFILAKIPGVRTDLADYTRPEGNVADFQRAWTPWMIVPQGKPVMPAPPMLAIYQQGGSGADYQSPDAATDLTCLGECAFAPAPLRLPDFAAAGQRQALTERGYFVRADVLAEGPPTLPPGGVAVWDEMLAYARANAADPQVPEALYWIVRAGRWGGSYNSSGKRAFQLLHARYAQSSWAKKTPYYYD